MITVASPAVPEAPRRPLLAPWESQLRQARAAVLFGFVTCKIKILKGPDPSHAFAILASPMALSGGGGSLSYSP